MQSQLKIIKITSRATAVHAWQYNTSWPVKMQISLLLLYVEVCISGKKYVQVHILMSVYINVHVEESFGTEMFLW